MPAHSFDLPATIDAIIAIADAIIEREPELTDADRNLGDGDHGLGMQRGMRAVKDKLATSPPSSIDQAFTSAGMAMISSMGGASGALFGTVFRAGGKALEGCSSFSSPELATFLQAALDGVVQRGGAKPGDKTMIDALAPAATTAAGCAADPFPQATESVAAAAEAGREASKDMIATMGRAKTLGERSLGHPDAGACSIAIILRTLAQRAAA